VRYQPRDAPLVRGSARHATFGDAKKPRARRGARSMVLARTMQRTGSMSISTQVSIPAADVDLRGEFSIPLETRGVVLFARSSQSCRSSRRIPHLAAALEERGLATLIVDLLTPEEERLDAIDRSIRCEVDLLAARLVAATDW